MFSMAGGLVALFDDVAALVKTTAASLDDVAAAAGKATAKAAGVVVDDAAVTPRYVEGLSPARELPIVWKIALGSIRNKLLIILPVALLLSAFAPWALTPILMLGGTYLAFEGAEKILEAIGLLKHHEQAEGGAKDEKKVIAGAIRTDLILSAEIMVIALNEVSHESVLNQALILIVVALLITVVVYGAVALIVKMDDIGLSLAGRRTGGVRALGRGLVKAMPVVMSVLSKVGVVAMLWVGGHILLDGSYKLGWHAPYGLVHEWEHAIEHAGLPAAGFLAWLVNTLCSAVVGLVVGAIVAYVVVGIRAVLPHRDHEAVAGDAQPVTEGQAGRAHPADEADASEERRADGRACDEGDADSPAPSPRT